METVLPGFAAMQNIHPMLVHFPIAFFLGALAMEVLSFFRIEKYHDVASSLLYLGTFMAMLTVPTGFLAMNSLARTDPRGHNAPGHDFIHLHGNWMSMVTITSILLSGYLFWMNKKGKRGGFRAGFVLGLILLSLLLTLGADRGARLVYEFGTGINPEVIKAVPDEHEHHSGH